MISVWWWRIVYYKLLMQAWEVLMQHSGFTFNSHCLDGFFKQMMTMVQCFSTVLNSQRVSVRLDMLSKVTSNTVISSWVNFKVLTVTHLHVKPSSIIYHKQQSLNHYTQRGQLINNISVSSLTLIVYLAVLCAVGIKFIKLDLFFKLS
jgi:hypothetical protein